MFELPAGYVQNHTATDIEDSGGRHNSNVQGSGDRSDELSVAVQQRRYYMDKLFIGGIQYSNIQLCSEHRLQWQTIQMPGEEWQYNGNIQCSEADSDRYIH